jgi:hypothetical protein
MGECASDDVGAGRHHYHHYTGAVKQLPHAPKRKRRRRTTAAAAVTLSCNCISRESGRADECPGEYLSHPSIAVQAEKNMKTIYSTPLRGGIAGG